MKFVHGTQPNQNPDPMKLSFVFIAIICAVLISNTASGENQDSTKSSLVVNESLGFVYLQKTVSPKEALTHEEVAILKKEALQLLGKWAGNGNKKVLIMGTEPKWIVHMENKKGFIILTVAFAHISHVSDSTILAQTIQ